MRRLHDSWLVPFTCAPDFVWIPPCLSAQMAKDVRVCEKDGVPKGDFDYVDLARDAINGGNKDMLKRNFKVRYTGRQGNRLKSNVMDPCIGCGGKGEMISKEPSTYCLGLVPDQNGNERTSLAYAVSLLKNMGASKILEAMKQLGQEIEEIGDPKFPPFCAKKEGEKQGAATPTTTKDDDDDSAASAGDGSAAASAGDGSAASATATDATSTTPPTSESGAAPASDETSDVDDI